LRPETGSGPKAKVAVLSDETPLGKRLGQGDTYEAALADAHSAIAFHVEIFGRESLAPTEDGPVFEAFVAGVAVPG
jgi:hypothetical protein